MRLSDCRVVKLFRGCLMSSRCDTATFSATLRVTRWAASAAKATGSGSTSTKPLPLLFGLRPHTVSMACCASAAGLSAG